MNEQKKIFTVFLVLVIIIISGFVAVMEYRFGGITKDEEEKLPLLVKVFASEASGNIPLKINFTALVLYYEGNVRYNWDFGDNGTSSEIKPAYTYNKSGSYTCSLIVTDSSGQESKDSVEISVKPSLAPSVSITMDELKPSRPFIPILRLPKISSYYWGRNLRQAMELKIFPSSLLNLPGFVSCGAQATSPEGNEIVSYRWELRPPTYTSQLGQQKKPVYYFEGKNITFPLLYTYVVAPYDLTIIVTDSKGNEGTDTIKFQVEENPIETQIATIKQSIGGFRKNIWHDLLKEDLKGPVGKFIGEVIFPLLPSWPLLKLFIIIKLISWDISLDIVPIIVEFLEKHPILRDTAKTTLEGLQSSLENMKTKFPKLEGVIDQAIGAIQGLLEQLGLANLKPELSDEKPVHNSELVSLVLSNVSITVTDYEGDPFNVSISGDYVNDISLIDQFNGTFNATLITPLPPETDIYWNVNVTSRGRWVNETYKFTTRWS